VLIVLEFALNYYSLTPETSYSFPASGADIYSEIDRTAQEYFHHSNAIEELLLKVTVERAIHILHAIAVHYHHLRPAPQKEALVQRWQSEYPDFGEISGWSSGYKPFSRFPEMPLRTLLSTVLIDPALQFVKKF
jgi:hypothetical protein